MYHYNIVGGFTMNTIIVLALLAWTTTCLAIIHNQQLRRAGYSMLCRVIRAIRTRTQKSKE